MKTSRVLTIICLIISISSFCYTNVTNGELQALNDLYNSCGGTNWINKTNWMSGDPCSNSWFGVYCTSGHVSALQLTTNGLYGTLPISLANLYELQTLSLDDNEISGSIPDTLYQIRSLGKIDFRKNFFGSTIPDNLGELLSYNLEYLDLSNNQLSGAIPSFFDSPPSYFFTNLSNNLFTCPIPSWASYTEANCIQWDITTIDPLCSIPNEDINIYGDNFLQSSGLLCTIYNVSTNAQIGSAPAQVISENHLICKLNYTFTKCDGNPGFETFINVNLRLTLNGQIITGNQTKQFGLINYSCNFGSTTGYFMIPTYPQVMEFCPEGNPTPYSCPTSLPYSSSSSTRYAPPTLNYKCANAANSTCYWAEPVSGSTPSCPFYYCQTSYWGGSTTYCYSAAYCPSRSSCYSTKSNCNSQSTCKN